MKTAIVHRYGAYGDHIHWSMIPRILHEEGYKVDIDVNYKGVQLFTHNPYVNKIHFYEPRKDTTIEDLKTRWEELDNNYDKVINLQWSLEYGTIAMENMPQFWWSQEARRKLYNKNYYDFTLDWAGYGKLKKQSIRGEVYYTEDEHAIVKKFLEPYKDKFVLLVNLSGTGLHKIYPYMGQVVQRFIDTHDNVVVITTGDKQCQVLEWEHDRVICKSGVWPFRQVLLVAKYVDGVIGCESGLMVGATMWGNRTCQMMTAASIKCHSSNVNYDYSLQSKAYCSPCFRGPYNYNQSCPIDPKYKLPICVMSFTKNKVFGVLERMYADYFYIKEGFVKNKGVNGFKPIEFKFVHGKCPICAKQTEEKVRLNSNDIYYRCEECKIYHTDKKNIRKQIYDKNYIDKYRGSNQLYQNLFDKYFHRIALAFNRFSGNFLEIGPINDVMCDNFKKKWQHLDIDILEINPFFTSKYNVIKADFDDYEFEDKKYDMIWMGHVFEHFLDPMKAVNKLYNILNDNGILYLSMPSPECINWDNPLTWNHWHVHEHYMLWDLEAIIKLLKDTGFDILFKEINSRPTKKVPVSGDYHIICRKSVDIIN